MNYFITFTTGNGHVMTTMIEPSLVNSSILTKDVKVGYFKDNKFIELITEIDFTNQTPTKLLQLEAAYANMLEIHKELITNLNFDNQYDDIDDDCTYCATNQSFIADTFSAMQDKFICEINHLKAVLAEIKGESTKVEG